MTEYQSFHKFGQESELTQVAEGNCPRINISTLPEITKINHTINDLEKIWPIMRYVDDTLFERRYGRIAQLMRLPLQTTAIKALVTFWDPSYRCFTFGSIDMTPTLEEYERILDFPNKSHRIYLRRNFEGTAAEVIKMLGLGMISQCRIANGGFKWKVIEARMKKNFEEGRLGDERYRLVAFAIFGLVLFPSEIGVISLEAASIFLEYEYDQINPSSAILAETMLSLNHCRINGKGVMRCCVPMLYLWIISHIETPRDIFNNFWWFDLRPLKVTIEETWRHWDEKAWIKKYSTLPQSNFKWKAPWMNNTVCIMSCGSKVWVPLIGVMGYISYAPALVTRQLGGMQYAPRTLGLADFMGLFKQQPYFKEMELIQQDWERPVLVKREEGSMFDSSVSQNYTSWRNGKLPGVIESSTHEHLESIMEHPKRKRTLHEEELRRQLERCGTDLGKSKRQQQVLEKQVEEENMMRNCLKQQLEEKEEQLISCKQWQKRAEIAEAIAKGSQEEVKDLISANDKLSHKNGITEKELIKIKKSTKSKIITDKETLDSLKKERSGFIRKIKIEKEKNRQVHPDIEEERRARAQYMVQLEEERSMRKTAEVDRRDYQKRAEDSKEQIMILQSELEIQEKRLRRHYGEIEKELHELKQVCQECQDIDSFTIQMNSKIAELDIAREELQRVRTTLTLFETMVRTLERSNEALRASNEVIITDNVLLHAKIRHMTKQIGQVARYAERMMQQATQVGNSVTKYREYMGALISFVEDLADKGDAL